MPVKQALAAVLSAPTSVAVRRLRGELLEDGVPEDSRAWRLLEEFHRFLDRLETGTSSREHSNLASKLDIGAISGVILEHLAEDTEPSERAMRLLSGAVSEGLMALATRQHVRAWEGELASIHTEAAWFLYGELWEWTRRRTPELSSTERRRLLDTLLGPLHTPDTPPIQRTILTLSLFLILLGDCEIPDRAAGADPSRRHEG
jgi:hypothetical protein